MILYPALDLLDGRAVRLTRGDYATAKVYSEHPAAVLAGFAAAGATYAHLVDLNGAQDPSRRQRAALEPLLKDSGLKVQIGGGVRSGADVEQLLRWGADRVVLGSAAVSDPLLVEALLGTVGPARITLAVDVNIGPDGVARAAIKGWQVATDARAEDLIRRFRAKGLRRVLCTDISRDGVAEGPNAALYEALAVQFPGLEVTASGGVRHVADLATLKSAGVHSAVAGRALYEGTLALKEGLAQC